MRRLSANFAVTAAMGAAVALLVGACSSEDPRKPEQPEKPDAGVQHLGEPDTGAPQGTAATDLVGGTLPPGAAGVDARSETALPLDDAGVAADPADAGAAPPQGDAAAGTVDPDAAAATTDPDAAGAQRELLPGNVHARFMLEEPKWDDAARFEQFCEDSIARTQALREAIKRDRGEAAPPTAEERVADFAQLSLELDTVDGLMGLMFAVSPHKPVRDVAEACEQRLAKLTTEMGLDRALYEALQQVEVDGLDELAQRFRERRMREFRRSGVDKDDKTRERLAAIDAELVTLGQSFRKNVNEDVRGIVVAAELLQEMPKDWLEGQKADEDGKIRVTTNYPDFFPFQTYVSDWQLRKALYREYNRRAYPQNGEILKRILELRAEYAKLLGHATWASYAAEDKMAGTVETIEEFIGSVEKIVRPRAERDLAELLERKRKDLPTAKQIEVYDRFYYVTKVQEEKFEFDAKQVREYFSYPKVKDGILAVYGDLFDLAFTKLDVETWHPSVEAYEMKADGKVVGRFYLDMHPRDDKYQHAAAFPIQTGLSNERIPWASLVCNFPNPADGEGHALMEHKDVVTFFHEFGHLIHHLLSRRGLYVDLAGFNVEWDFVEAPSQILEEWAWDAGVLRRFALHYDSDEPIPLALVEKMKAADEFGKGLSLMRQVFYTAYSFFLHKESPKRLDLDRVTDRIYKKYSPFPRLEGSKVYANFGHLIGYTSLYYTYQWSLAIAKDLFTEFEREGIMNKEVARRYRTAILEQGGTRDAEDLVREFLGRDRNLDAYRRWIQSDE